MPFHTLECPVVQGFNTKYQQLISLALIERCCSFDQFIKHTACGEQVFVYENKRCFAFRLDL